VNDFHQEYVKIGTLGGVEQATGQVDLPFATAITKAKLKERKQMEMRLLTTELEREIFAQRVLQVRAEHGGHYREVRNGMIDNRKRLAASRLFGLFEDEVDLPHRMIAGIAIHSLEAFPQSCAEPDLSHLSPNSVFECGDHWSLGKGAGMRMWCGAAIQIARMEPRAILAYLAVGPSDHMGFYTAMGFAPTGNPAVYPYVERQDGGNPLLQPMVLDGVALQKLVIGASRVSFEVLGDYEKVRFGSSPRLRPVADRAALQSTCGGGGNRGEISRAYFTLITDEARV
jgi:hypothetical protein